jgi:hypothetical protein
MYPGRTWRTAIQSVDRFLRNPQALVTLVATVDAADLALFAASFKAMEVSFGFTPGKLGMLQMWQSLSFSVCLPVWGVFLPVHGARYLLVRLHVNWSTFMLAAELTMVTGDSVGNTNKKSKHIHRVSHA